MGASAGRILVLVLLAASIPLVQQRVDTVRGGYSAQEEALYLWSGEHVRRLNPGLENVMADLYWLRTVQYFGGQRIFSKDRRFDLLLPLVTITTTLDPRLEIAYRYGAIFLGEPWPTGAGRAQDAVALMERGVGNLPRSWRLRQDLGMFRYSYLGDGRGAAAVLLEAAKLPEAPFWLETLAADLLANADDRATSREVWTRMYEQADEPPIKGNALIHLQRLDALDAVDALNAAAKDLEAKLGRKPRDAREFVSLLGPRAPLADPLGVPFEYHADQGRFSISRESWLWRPTDRP